MDIFFRLCLWNRVTNLSLYYIRISDHLRRRDYRDVDLRNRLGRRYSPRGRYPPIKDARSRHMLREYSPSRSLEESSDREHRRKRRLNSQSDVSGKLSGGSDYAREKLISSDSKHTLQMQLRDVHSDVRMLERHKTQLDAYLEESVQEVDSLTSKIEELEGQLYKEKKECRRINSRIKKFIKAHDRYSRLQDELKRSQTQLQKLGNQLGLEAVEGGNREEDSSINVISDGENINYTASPWDELQTHDPPSMRVPDLNQASHEELHPHGGRLKLSRWTYSRGKHDQDFYTGNGKNNGPSAGEPINKRDIHISSAVSMGDKVLRTANAPADITDEVKDAELTSAGNDEAAAFQNKRWSFAIPTMSPIHKKSYRQGDDANLDTTGDLEHAEKVDVASTS
ncbi:hypothetical protein SAY87_027228 [Trapa incisa]|uniref:Zinc finger C-x8-C-x5-C-x3-H type family protein n=1 Tax=Trapa incisa TaxID=236973 RepID=A0AAN7GVR9_9MYRT|nr:hypothetical protein SAY87_027228 [Trapa incisa]